MLPWRRGSNGGIKHTLFHHQSQIRLTNSWSFLLLLWLLIVALCFYRCHDWYLEVVPVTQNGCTALLPPLQGMAGYCARHSNMPTSCCWSHHWQTAGRPFIYTAATSFKKKQKKNKSRIKKTASSHHQVKKRGKTKQRQTRQLKRSLGWLTGTRAELWLRPPRQAVWSYAFLFYN